MNNPLPPGAFFFQRTLGVHALGRAPKSYQLSSTPVQVDIHIKQQRPSKAIRRKYNPLDVQGFTRLVIDLRVRVHHPSNDPHEP